MNQAEIELSASKNESVDLFASNGTALIECAFVIPILLLLMRNCVNFGAFIYSWITVDNAARSALEYQVYSGVAVGFPSAPSFTQVQAVFNTDVSSLPHYSAGVNPTLKICSKFNTGAAVCNGTGSASIPSDPEPTVFTIYSADVAYTYTPIFAAFNYPSLGISLTIPPTVLHRQVVMRSLQ